LRQLQITEIGHRGAARCCKGPVGLLRVTQGCRRLWGAMMEPPMVPRVTDLQILFFKSIAKNELSIVQWYNDIFYKKMAENILVFSVRTPINHLRKNFDNIECDIFFLSIVRASI
jgi:hypothetical protein